MAKYKVSVLGIIFTMILAVVVILLFERVMFDINRLANPVIEKTISQDMEDEYYARKPVPAPIEADGEVIIKEEYKEPRLASERSALSGTRIYYPREQAAEYRLYRLLIHGVFVLPIFLLMFLFYYWINLKKRNENWFVVTWAYMAGAIWVLLHLLGQTGRYVVDAYKNMAIYIILVFMAVVLTSLAVFLQKKKHED